MPCRSLAGLNQFIARTQKIYRANKKSAVIADGWGGIKEPVVNQHDARPRLLYDLAVDSYDRAQTLPAVCCTKTLLPGGADGLNRPAPGPPWRTTTCRNTCTNGSKGNVFVGPPPWSANTSLVLVQFWILLICRQSWNKDIWPCCWDLSANNVSISAFN